MDNRLRYISVAGMIIHPDQSQFLIGKRSPHDSFKPDSTVFPSGRVEDNELVEERLIKEVRREVHILTKTSDWTYVNNCTFPREGHPVNQLCFATIYNHDNLPTKSKELYNIQWISPKEFKENYPVEGYVAELHKFVDTAIRKNLLYIK